MKTIHLLTFALVIFCSAGESRGEELPDHLVGLLRNETHVGVQYFPGTNDYILTVLNEAEVGLEQDAAKLDLTELTEKYPQVNEQAMIMLTGVRKKMVAAEPKLFQGFRYGEPKLVVSPTAGNLHRVIYVGEDYVLMKKLEGEEGLMKTLDGEEGSKIAVNSRLIREIRWYGGPRFRTSVPHLRENRAE